MTSSNEVNSTVTLTFSLPPEFVAPTDGDCETRISIQVANASTPITVTNWGRPAIFSGQWRFSFQHHYTDISVKYQINVAMTRNRQPLLVDMDHYVVVSQVPFRQTVHLSPIGQLFVEAQPPYIVDEREAVTIRAHEQHEPDAELVRINHDEQTAAAFYLNYDPREAIPGKRYALEGRANKYQQPIAVHPATAVLVPVGFTADI